MDQPEHNKISHGNANDRTQTSDKTNTAAFHFRDRVARIPEELADALTKLVQAEAQIIVEGKRDAEALLAIGVSKERITASAYKSIPQLIAELEKKLKEHHTIEVIDLMDYDMTGRLKSRELYQHARGIKVDRELKKTILTKIKSRCIEDLLNFLEKSVK